MKYLRWFLVFVPVTVAAHLLHVPSAVVFAAAALALLPLSGIVGEATEQLAAHVGEAWGGLLNATFGNLAELIIVFVAIRAGAVELVKASLVGSVVGNLMLVLGASLFVGGIRRQTLTFRRDLVAPSVTNLLIATSAMALPTLARFSDSHANMGRVSLGGAGVLILLYALLLVKQFRTVGDQATLAVHEVHEALGARWSKRRALVVLVATAITLGGMSEILVHHLEGFCDGVGLTPTFVGLIVVPLVGNIAEHFVAIQVAAKNRMDLSLAVSIGSATQIALLVAPLAVFAGMVLGNPVTLDFPPLAVTFMYLSVFFAWIVTSDSNGDWYEGVQLICLYFLVGVICYYVQVSPLRH